MEHELITIWLRSGKHKLHGGVETGWDHWWDIPRN